ncbi:hypothetical protein XI04_03700 [Bradyrhizobium sp. CCBAU 11430]|nr:hypothetical protein [Bradyrhizobium sp. CCBAU 11430]
MSCKPLAPETKENLIAELERVTKQLSEIDKVVAQQALDDPRALKLIDDPRREFGCRIEFTGLHRRHRTLPGAG